MKEIIYLRESAFINSNNKQNIGLGFFTQHKKPVYLVIILTFKRRTFICGLTLN